MKKLLLMLCLGIGLCFMIAGLWPTQLLPFSAIPLLSDDEFETIASERSPYAFSPYSLVVLSKPLPLDEDTNTWYCPALTDDISVRLPLSWKVARTAPDAASSDSGTCRIILYNQTVYIICHLTETGLPVIELRLQRFDLEPQYISSERINANAIILSQQADGTLQRETNRVQIKIRGGSSLAYEKKSYTLSFLNESHRASNFSLLGLPADHKFALNSLYEDDSKIRDALAYQLWAKLEPNNALQFTYTELIINNRYLGLYGLHGLPTENSLHTSENDIIYKIEDHIDGSSAAYSGQLPSHEYVYGSDSDHTVLRFFETLANKTSAFPTCYDRENFIHYAIQMEILSCLDTELKNMVITYWGDEDIYRLTGWDMDLSFGTNWDDNTPLGAFPDISMSDYRFLHASENRVNVLSILYSTYPDFRAEIAARYRELRETVFTDEALLGEAAEFYDMLTDCGARARDAARWPNSAISEDNGFIEAFIPARMAFLDAEFAGESFLMD